jgi:rRNA maturation RNase YbeY
VSSTIEVVDRAGLTLDDGALRALVEAVLEAERAVGAIVVVLVDEAAMLDLNSRYRGADEPTDVLSFPETDEAGDWPSGEFGAVEHGGRAELGEVVICPTVLIRYALEDGRRANVQLAWTLVHGVLHLLGYDHEADQGEMRRREEELLVRLASLVRALPILAPGGASGRAKSG